MSDQHLATKRFYGGRGGEIERSDVADTSSVGLASPAVAATSRLSVVRMTSWLGSVPREIAAELIADRVWRSRSQLELAIVEYLGSYNAARLHESLSDIPPLEYEQQHRQREPITLVGATV